MDMTLTNAVNLGWKPEPISRPVTLHCQAGCGRCITVDRRDRVSLFICTECRRAYAGFIARERRRRVEQRRQAPAERP